MDKINLLHLKKQIKNGDFVLAKDENKDLILIYDTEKKRVFTIGKISELKDINEKVEMEFNQSACDWRYRASCASDTNCADECNMKCRYR